MTRREKLFFVLGVVTALILVAIVHHLATYPHAR
jgi:cell division protein FtsL